mgnify:FL=1
MSDEQKATTAHPFRGQTMVITMPMGVGAAFLMNALAAQAEGGDFKATIKARLLINMINRDRDAIAGPYAEVLNTIEDQISEQIKKVATESVEALGSTLEAEMTKLNKKFDFDALGF